MSSDPLVSVVVPTYNRADLIGETIESILAQTLRELELIIVSDGSTDATESVVRACNDPRVVFIAQPNSGGPATPRNTGVRRARGKYVAFCDDDDLWRPQKLEKQVAVMEAQPDVALTYTGGVTFGDQDFFSKSQIRCAARHDHFGSLKYGNFITNSSVVVRKSVLDSVGPFDVDRFMRGTEDYELWLRVARGRRLVGIDEVLFDYRIHSSNLAGNRTKATRRSIHVLRTLDRRTGAQQSVLLPLMWQFFKYAIYALARR
jgi:glycosyltransferase involved in cell wall biosynthesis